MADCVLVVVLVGVCAVNICRVATIAAAVVECRVAFGSTLATQLFVPRQEPGFQVSDGRHVVHGYHHLGDVCCCGRLLW